MVPNEMSVPNHKMRHIYAIQEIEIKFYPPSAQAVSCELDLSGQWLYRLFSMTLHQVLCLIRMGIRSQSICHHRIIENGERLN